MSAEQALTTEEKKVHRLHHEWIMWYDYGRFVNENNPDDGLIKLSSICDVERFWTVMDSVKRASSLAFGANYHFFKIGVKPEWEDPANSQGGRWSIRIMAEDAQTIDSTWERVLMSLIGEYIFEPLVEQFEEIADAISGAVMARRRLNTRIELWTTKCFHGEILQHAEDRIREIVGLDVKLDFHPHAKHRDKAESKVANTEVEGI